MINNIKMFKQLFILVFSTLVVLNSQTVFAGYLHNPMENPVVLRDVVPAPGNVFGYAPARRDAKHPDSTLHHFASGNFADFESVGNYRKVCIKYHEYVSDRLDELMALMRVWMRC